MTPMMINIITIAAALLVVLVVWKLVFRMVKFAVMLAVIAVVSVGVLNYGKGNEVDPAKYVPANFSVDKASSLAKQSIKKFL